MALIADAYTAGRPPTRSGSSRSSRSHRRRSASPSSSAGASRPLGLLAGALALAGLIGLAAVITIDGFAWGIAGELSANPEVGPDGAAAVLKDLQESELVATSTT